MSIATFHLKMFSCYCYLGVCVCVCVWRERNAPCDTHVEIRGQLFFPFFLETVYSPSCPGPRYVAQDGLESQTSTCLCLLRAVIKD